MMYCVIVVYNKDISLSPTYSFMQKYKDIQIIVCDNSTIQNNNESEVLKDGNIYISMHGNMGLSKAYNAAIKVIQSGYIILLDDDTSLTEEYMDCVYKSIKSNKDIYVPIVKTENMMMSPVLCENGLIKKAESINDLKGNISAINSGLVIHSRVFKGYKYPEAMFLDYIDHAFMYEMNQRNKEIEIMNISIHQNFSVEEYNKESEKNRFKIFKKDVVYYYKKIVGKSRYYTYIITRRKLRLALKYKDIRILGW
jgi:rhamnosyltransferase